MEIERLHDMLTAAGIEHTWINRNPRGWKRGGCDFGWQITAYYPNGDLMVSVIQGYGTYGAEVDRLEIMGLLTPEEAERDSVVGWLTAEDVFGRITRALGVEV